MKKRLKRYTSTPKIYPMITLTGNVFLRYEQEEEIASAVRGDVMLFLNVERSARSAEYHGYHVCSYAGYLRADVFDGKLWKPLSLNELFPEKENHFSKTERPFDRFRLCCDIIRAHKGSMLKRTYREHYVLAEDDAGE